MMSVAEFLELRKRAPAKLTPTEQQAITDACNWGMTTAPKLDADFTEGWNAVLADWENPNPNVQAVVSKYGGWGIGSLASSPGMVQKAIVEAKNKKT